MESPTRILGLLRRHPVWQAASDGDVLPLLKRAKVASLTSGTLIVRPNEPAREVHFLLEGALRVYYPATRARGELTVKLLLAPASFGAAECVTAGAFSECIQALTPSRVLALDSTTFFELLRRNPAVCFGQFLELARQFAVDIRYAKSSDGVYDRVIAILVAYASRFGDSGVDGWVVIDRMLTQSKLASQSGTTTRTLARVLARLYREGLVRRRGQRFAVASIDRLLASADGARANIAFTAMTDPSKTNE